APPQISYVRTQEGVETSHKSLTEERGEEAVIVGGSAGGGLAIGCSQWLATTELPQPKGLVVISPWLDVSLSHPEMEKYAKLDPMLRPDNLKIIGRIWAGNSELDYYKVSPIHGELTGLPKFYRSEEHTSEL